jgi:molybdopterin-synthase adenylyltransferase
MLTAAVESVVFSHEVEAVLRAGPRCGRGVAHLADVHEGIPDVVRFSLDPGPAAAGPAAIAIDWHVGHGEDALCAIGARSAGGALWIDTTASPVRAECNVTFPSGLTWRGPVGIVTTGAQAFTRNLAILESTTLDGATVLCIGLGSGGSVVVDLLARAGVGRLLLWDMDRLEAHNIGRHVCTLADIGRRKTVAMRDHVHAINPVAGVDCIDADVLQSPALLEDAVRRADCVVAGTDNNASRFAINEAAWRLGKPAFYGRAFTRASGGDVIQVIPPTTPCYCCHAAGRVVEEEVSSSRDAGRVAYADRPVPVEPGLCVDVQPVANMIARLCLLRLCQRAASPLGVFAAEMNAPLYLWANRREYQFAGWKPMERSYDRLSVLRWYGITVPKDKECPTCGSLG